MKLGYARQLTPLDTGFINYRLHVFENQGGPTTITNTPTLGWKRQLTPNTVLTLEGGPRFVSGGPSFVDDTVEPEAHASLEHSFKLAKVALEYHRTEAIVVGQPGKVELESLTGSFEIEPVRLLKLRFQPGYYRTFGGEDPTATVYGFLLGALYPIKSWLTARLDYRFAYQKQADTTLPHNIVTLSLDFVYPVRSRRSAQHAVPWGRVSSSRAGRAQTGGHLRGPAGPETTSSPLRRMGPGPLMCE